MYTRRCRAITEEPKATGSPSRAVLASVKEMAKGIPQRCIRIHSGERVQSDTTASATWGKQADQAGSGLQCSSFEARTAGWGRASVANRTVACPAGNSATGEWRIEGFACHRLRAHIEVVQPKFDQMQRPCMDSMLVQVGACIKKGR